MRAFAWLAALGARPRPDVRILELEAKGGGVSVFIQNQGTGPCRCGTSATVGERLVQCSPAIVDLLPHAAPTIIRIFVPEEDLGRELTVRVNDGKRSKSVSRVPFRG